MERERGPFERPISPASIAARITELERALADSERAVGFEHPDTLTARGALVRGYLFLGRATEAIALAEKNLPACENVLGPDHSDALQARNDLGIGYRSAGHAADAVAIAVQIDPDKLAIGLARATSAKLEEIMR